MGSKLWWWVVQGHVFGDTAGEEADRTVVMAVLKSATDTNLFLGICMHFGELELESRKDAALIFGALLRIKIEDTGARPMVDYVKKQFAILEMLFVG